MVISTYTSVKSPDWIAEILSTRMWREYMIKSGYRLNLK